MSSAILSCYNSGSYIAGCNLTYQKAGNYLLILLLGTEFLQKCKKWMKSEARYLASYCYAYVATGSAYSCISLNYGYTVCSYLLIVMLQHLPSYS